MTEAGRDIAGARSPLHRLFCRFPVQAPTGAAEREPAFFQTFLRGKRAVFRARATILFSDARDHLAERRKAAAAVLAEGCVCVCACLRRRHLSIDARAPCGGTGNIVPGVAIRPAKSHGWAWNSHQKKKRKEKKRKKKKKTRNMPPTSPLPSAQVANARR